MVYNKNSRKMKTSIREEKSMPILYDEAARAFLLQGKNSTYAIQISKKDTVCQMHWGEKLEDVSELPTLYDMARRMTFKELKVEEDDFQEYRGFGGFSFIEPALKVTFADGTRNLFLKYQSHEIDGENLRIITRDPQYALEVTLCYRLCPEFDVIERKSLIKNQTEGDVVLESVYSANWHLPYRDDYRLTTFVGGYSHEYNRIREMLQKGRRILESRRGLSGPEFIPFFMMDEGKTTEDMGNCYYGSVMWSGNWKLVFERDQLDRTIITGGVNDFDFGYCLEPGREYETPVFFAGYSAEGGFGEASRILHRYEIQEIIHPKEKERLLPIIYNAHNAFGNQIWEEAILKEIDRAHEIGVELFIMEGGWTGQYPPFSPVNNGQSHRTGYGLWEINKVRFPNGIKPCADRCHEYGMKFGLWIEPEAVYHDCSLVREHPDWIVGYDNREPEIAGFQCYSLNLANDDCCEYVTNKLIQIIGENGIDYIKNDFNRQNPHLGWRGMPIKFQKNSWDKYVRNMWKCYGTVKKTFPDLIFENSAGGGMRTDLAMLRIAGRMHRSDNQDPVDSLNMFEGMSHFVPGKFQGGACFISIPQSQWLNRRETTLQYRGHMAMLSSMSISMKLQEMAEKDLQELKYLVALAKKIRPVTQLGELYRLVSVDDKPYGVYEYVNKDASKAVVFMMSQNMQFGKMPEPARLKGLKLDAKYHITAHGMFWTLDPIKPGFQDEIPTREKDFGIFTGRQLMRVGVQVFIQGHANSLVLQVDEIQSV